MRLKRFHAERVHGFLNFDISFFPDLTFLTGINGSGKTTALNAIAALLAPDISVLVNLEYNEATLEFEIAGNNQAIGARKSAGGVELFHSLSPDTLILRPYIPDNDQSYNQQSTAENNYYRELASAFSSHPVMAFILSLPSPMFLGLDRRSRGDDDYIRRYAPIRSNRLTKKIFSNSLSASLNAAARLAEDNRKSALIAAGRIAEDLQKEILLGLLETDVETSPIHSVLTAPTSKDVAEIESLKRLLNTLPQVLKLSKDDVTSRVLPLFDRLQEFINVIPPGKSVEQLLNKNPDAKVVNALLGWSGSQHQLRRIRNLQATVSKYNKRRGRFLDASNRYLKLVNAFLMDSFKSISFDENGNLGVIIEGLEGAPKDVSSLSSGEAQIFVIISQLSFSQLAASDNVFIIDEPELSLHVDWQEIFVSSIQSANPDVQFILASHSPSIILDRLENCIDMSPIKPGLGKQ